MIRKWPPAVTRGRKALILREPFKNNNNNNNNNNNTTKRLTRNLFINTEGTQLNNVIDYNGTLIPARTSGLSQVNTSILKGNAIVQFIILDEFPSNLVQRPL